MSKYAWDTMKPCQSCIFKDFNADICHKIKHPIEKPSPIEWGDCSEWMRDSKWWRMTMEEKKAFLGKKNLSDEDIDYMINNIDVEYLSKKEKFIIMSPWYNDKQSRK